MNTISINQACKEYRIGKSAWPTMRDRLDSFFANGRDLLSGRRNAREHDHKFKALKDVTFNVRKGESVAIVGPNGAGKSTILKLLAGVTQPASGDIQIKGKVAAMIELGAGLHPELTGRENIYLYGAIMGMKRSQIRSKEREIIEFSEIEEFIDTPLKRYSSGMQARLGFSVTAHIEADILLVDEVLSVGDISFQMKCAEKLAEYQKNGITIVFVSHNLESVRKLCDRTILLNKGQVVHDGSTAESIRRYYKLIAGDKVAGSRGTGHESASRSQARIKSVGLFNAEGKPSRNFLSGEEALLRVEIECFERLPNPHIGFFIRTPDRNVIFDTNSALLGKEAGVVSGGSILVSEFSFRMNFLKGTYYVGNHFECEKMGNYYDYVDPAVTFTVREDYSHYGIVGLSPSVDLLISEKINHAKV